LKNRDVKNVPHSVHDRLANIARSEGRAFQEVLNFYDIWYLSTNFFFDGSILLDAVTSTFSRRETTVPDDLDSLLAAYSSDLARQVQWSAFTRGKGLVEAPQDFGAIVKAVSFFVAPILHAVSSGTEFDKNWDPAAGWR
jgi:uncharacterized sodium:solute symporter family permease YidK